MRLLSASITILLLFAPSVALAHGNGGHEGPSHDPSLLCDRFIAKDDSDMPRLYDARWQEVKRVEFGFRYVFYRDTARPELAVAAMIVIGKIPGTDTTITRITWQVDGELRSVRLEVDEMVCVKSVFGKDGKKYDLEGLMKRLTGELAGGRKRNDNPRGVVALLCSAVGMGSYPDDSGMGRSGSS